MDKQLKDIGEFGFIGRFAPHFQHLVSDDDGGIGDDCAILSIDEAHCHLVSTDLLIEDVHFLQNEISPYDLGYKSLAVNLSDIAAMGGRARYSFLSLGLPATTPLAYLDAFMEGYHALSEKYNVPLMGGDTTRSSDKLCINVCVIGESLKHNVKQRSMAREGDILAVTGTLGDSAGGLKAMLEQLRRDEAITTLIARHHRVEPRLNEGRWLAQQKGVHAMMDVSDGMASDLPHLLKASNTGAKLYLDQIPISETLASVASAQQWDLNALTLAGGEDYELLVSIAEDEFHTIEQAYLRTFGTPLYRIGEINAQGILSYDGAELGEGGGFDHFKAKTSSTH